MAEETGLTREEVGSFTAGLPLEVPDDTLDRIWVVHPFLAKVIHPERIRLDWEHTDMQWVEPEMIQQLETVPQLWEAWQRVNPAVPAQGEIASRIREIKNDRESGAACLAGRALAILGDTAAVNQNLEPAAFFKEMELLVKVLSTVRPSMAPIANAARRWLKDLRSGADENMDGKALGELGSSLAGRHQERLAQARGEAAVVASKTAGKASRLITCSYSATVADVLVRCQAIATSERRSFLVLVAYSGGHGERLAVHLRQLGVPTLIFPDDQVDTAISEADLALIGADTVLPGGSVVNGCPSLALARAARKAGVPFYAVADSYKWADEEVPVEEGFELIPVELVSGIISEKGPEV